MDFIINPLTNRRIKVGGETHRKLLRDGVIPKDTKKSQAASLDCACSSLPTLPNRNELFANVDNLYTVCKAAASHCFFNKVDDNLPNDSLGLQMCVMAFLELENSNDTQFSYEPNRCGVWIVKDENGLRCVNPKSRYSCLIPINTDEYKKLENSTSSLLQVHQDVTNIPNIPNIPNNEAMYATLDTLDNWSDLPTWRLFVTHDGYAFDVLFLIKLCTDQLNTEKSFNPYPRFPNNPFTREALSAVDLKALSKTIKRNRIKVALVLKEFLSSSGQVLWDCPFHPHWMQRCIEHFEKSMRYVRQFSEVERNGELQLLCYWNSFITPIAPSEANVLKYLQTFKYTMLNKLNRGPHFRLLPLSYYISEGESNEKSKYNQNYSKETLPTS